MNSKKNLVLEYDDFHWLNPENCIETIRRFKKLVPNIKLTMFTVPYLRSKALFENKEWCYEVRELVSSGTLEIARHGYLHSPLEYEYCDYDYAIKSLILGDQILNHSGIQFVKVFRGPYWGLNSYTVSALNDLGYTHLYNHIDHSEIGHNFNGKVVFYNWNLGKAPPDFNLSIGHGHTHNVCGNGIEETFDNVIDFINTNEPNFLFSSEV